MVRAVPNPPRLHWGWVCLLSFITLGLFGMAWLIVQSCWLRKVRGPIYFQYHLFDLEVTEAMHLFRGPLRTELVEPSQTSLTES